MYFLINRDEIVRSLAEKLTVRYLCRDKIRWPRTKKLKKKLSRPTTDQSLVTPNDFVKAVAEDLQEWRNSKEKLYKLCYKQAIKLINQNFDQLGKFYNTHNKIQKHYASTSAVGLVKIVGPQLDRYGVWITPTGYRDPETPVLMRNIVNNESLIKEKLQTKKEFWFLDSGYTNFLTPGRKVWHRLVKNHIHCSVKDLWFPADRLSNLVSFPQPWRTSGHKILVVESSESHCDLFGTTLNQWRSNIKQELELYTDRPVEFRAKEPNKKIRSNLYQQLQDDDYYCVISDASAAAIEAIWCGIPVITLNQHITNTVSRNQLSDINNLYRGPLGDWLCALTYSQFTVSEFADGTALKLLREYHHV